MNDTAAECRQKKSVIIRKCRLMDLIRKLELLNTKCYGREPCSPPTALCTLQVGRRTEVGDLESEKGVEEHMPDVKDDGRGIFFFLLHLNNYPLVLLISFIVRFFEPVLITNVSTAVD